MARVRLGEVFQISSGGTPSKQKTEYYLGGSIPWVKTGDLKDKFVSEDIERITKDGLDNSSAKLFPKNTVLIAMYGATIGACSILPFEASTNQACAAFLPNDAFNPEFLFYFLSSQRNQFIKDGVGGAQPNISAGYLKNVFIPLISIDQQSEIVRSLNRVDTLISLRKQQLAKLDELIKARFVEMFGDESKRMKISEVCSIITDGTHQPPKFVSNGIPFIFVSNITGNIITYETEKYIDQHTYDELIKRTPIEIGDVLLSTVGSYGHPAIVKTDKKFLFQRHIAYLKPRKELIDSEYLHGAILSPDIQRQIDESVKGIAQKTLNLSEIKKMMIPVPNLKRQKEFASVITRIDKSKAVVQKSLDKLETLKNALMQQYFE